jgi:hypothetical protein
MTLEYFSNITTAIVNMIAILTTIIGAKVFFNWIFPKLLTKKAIKKRLNKRGCNNCPKKENTIYENGGFCQFYNPASFGREDLKDCKCFNK